eukprot:jgi/Bigna1/144433/aug1.87_g19141
MNNSRNHTKVFIVTESSARTMMIYVLLLTLPLAAKVNGLEVVGLSPDRSGTDSLKEALEHLGYGPVYTIKEMMVEESGQWGSDDIIANCSCGWNEGISTSGHIEKWLSAANGEESDESVSDGLRDMLSEFRSGVGFPISSFPREMLRLFPKAKFIVTKRPASEWFESFNSSTCKLRSGLWYQEIVRKFPFFPFTRVDKALPLMDAVVQKKFAAFAGSPLASFEDVCVDGELAKGIYDRWHEAVEHTIPKDKLFTIDLKTASRYANLATFLKGEEAGQDKKIDVRQYNVPNSILVNLPHRNTLLMDMTRNVTAPVVGGDSFDFWIQGEETDVIADIKGDKAIRGLAMAHMGAVFVVPFVLVVCVLLILGVLIALVCGDCSGGRRDQHSGNDTKARTGDVLPPDSKKKKDQ